MNLQERIEYQVTDGRGYKRFEFDSFNSEESLKRYLTFMEYPIISRIEILNENMHIKNIISKISEYAEKKSQIKCVVIGNYGPSREFAEKINDIGCIILEDNLPIIDLRLDIREINVMLPEIIKEEIYIERPERPKYRHVKGMRYDKRAIPKKRYEA